MWRMRNDRLALLVLVALVGCRGGDGDGNRSGNAPAPRSGSVQTDTLTGLYEGGEGPRRNQMCMIQRENSTRFGLVVWAQQGETSCSGSGRATREGSRLRLAMEGDETCVIVAQLDGRRVTLPAGLPQGCAYYCGPNAQMAGAAFDKTGGTEADAMRAVDLVEDPLCG